MVPTIAATAVQSTPTPVPANEPLVVTIDTASPRTPQDARPVHERYQLGGIDFGNGHAPLSMAYPASLENDATTRFDNLDILVADAAGTQYQNFRTKFGGSVYTYLEMASGSFVLSAHSGTMARSGLVLEAEPLRQLIEGNLHATRPLSEIEARLGRLIGREFRFSQSGVTARFRLVQTYRMRAADVAAYQHKAGSISELMDPIADPGRSFILFFCSGRQSGEPQQTFAGRYLLLLELID